jgi:hypothetical protein
MRIRIGAWEQSTLFGGTVPRTSWPGVSRPSVVAPLLVGMAGTSPAMTEETMFASAQCLILMRMGLVPAMTGIAKVPPVQDFVCAA